LRPHLDEAQFVSQATRQMRENDWKLVVVESNGQIRAAAGFRILENLFSGRHLYVDDLVTLPSDRSAGHGRRLLAWLEQYAIDHGCGRLELDSGVQRARAHRFYFREGMHISSYHFRKDLTQASAD
jgi:GNAT superfamily N-acetyltransferase